MRTLAVIPTYNEVATIGEVLGVLYQAAPDVEALVVDDGSPDGTADLVEQIAIERPGVHVMRRVRKDGLGRAYLAGFSWAMEKGYDAVVQMDADLSHDPRAVPALLAALGDADLAVGCRYMPGGSIPNWSWYRRQLSRWGNQYSSRLLGVPLRDMTSGFRAYRASLISRLLLQRVRSTGYGFQIEVAYLAYLAGARVAEVPIRFVDRVEGKSKMSVRIALEALGLVTWWGARRLWRTFLAGL